MTAFKDINPEFAETWLCMPRDWRRPHVEDNYVILWDVARSYGQIWPRPTPCEVSAYYQTDDYYTHGNTKTTPNENVPLGQRLMTKLSWLADSGIEPDQTWWSTALGSKPLRILEIGCGNGSNLSLLASLGHDVIGIEPDPRALQVAREKGHQVYEGTAESLPVEVLKCRFDAVIFMHVLEHCIDPFQAAANAVHLLNEDGVVVAEVPNNDCAGKKRFGPLWHWLDVPRHLNFFTGDSLSHLFTSVGLSIDSLSFRGYCRQFRPGWKAAQSEIAKTFGMPEDKRISGMSYWAYLMETAWAKDAQKFDSVRVVGRVSSD